MLKLLRAFYMWVYKTYILKPCLVWSRLWLGFTLFDVHYEYKIQRYSWMVLIVPLKMHSTSCLRSQNESSSLIMNKRFSHLLINTSIFRHVPFTGTCSLFKWFLQEEPDNAVLIVTLQTLLTNWGVSECLKALWYSQRGKCSQTHIHSMIWNNQLTFWREIWSDALCIPHIKWHRLRQLTKKA